jgi:hypothetical protein
MNGYFLDDLSLFLGQSESMKEDKQKFIKNSLKSLKENYPELSDIFDLALKTRIIIDKKLDATTKTQLETLLNSMDSI